MKSFGFRCGYMAGNRSRFSKYYMTGVLADLDPPRIGPPGPNPLADMDPPVHIRADLDPLTKLSKNITIHNFLT